MAVFYTNFLTGNDSTGTGTWANPFKTIYRGTQAITGNNDEVRVVGSGWTDLPGTLTFTHGSNTITTSNDLTSLFPELTSTPGNNKVVITVNDEFGFFKSVFTVVADTATTLTMPTNWSGNSGTYSAKRLTTQHYYATTSPTSPLGAGGTFESFDTAKFALYTNLQISGGWTADGVQDGVTAIINAYGSSTTASGSFVSQAFSPITSPSNLKISGFLFSNLSSFNSQGNSRHAIGDLWFIRCADIFNTSSTDIITKTGETSNLYVYDSRISGSFQVSISLGQLYMNLWHTMVNISGGTVGMQSGSAGGATTMDKFVPAKAFNQLHLRRAYSDAFFGYANTGYFTLGTWMVYPLLINELYVYGTNSTVDGAQFPIFGNGTDNRNPSLYGIWIKKFYGSGKVGLTLGQWGSPFVTLGDGTQSLNDLRLCSTPATNALMTSTQRNWRVKTTEGNWRAYGPVYTGGQSSTAIMVVREELVEKVTGTNSLAIAGARKYPSQSATVNDVHAPIAFVPAFKSTKTLTIKMKTNGISTAQFTGLSLRIPVTNEFVTLWSTAITGLSSSWQDFTYSINLSSSTFPDEVTAFELWLEQDNLPATYAGSLLYIDSISLA